MYNIRIKSVPNKAKTGSQLDYSLVDRNTLFLKPNTPVNSDVKNTMGAVPRHEANIEAEGGETIVGDINNDGFLEHQTIVGKRHTQGGVPLNVPEGSFIFSDTKKMIIKDPEIHSMFGMKPNKKGYTPAEIAKKYNINDYIAILKDPAKDKYSKETAQIMLESNLKKLGMLSLVQESMKGFPDGIPAIAESVMGQMQGQGEQESPEQEQAEGPQAPQEEMQEGEQPQQRYGGELPKAQYGFSTGNYETTPDKKSTVKKQATAQNDINTNTDNINTGSNFFINNKPNQILKKYKGFYGDEWVVFKNPIQVLNADGNKDELTEMKVEDWNKLTNINKKTNIGQLKVGHKLNVFSPNSYTDISNIGAWSQPSALISNPGIKYNTLTYSKSPVNIPKETNPYLKPGFEYVHNNATYKVIEPNAYDRNGKDVIKVAQIKDPNRNIGSFFDTDFGTTTIPKEEYLKMFNLNKNDLQNEEGYNVGAKNKKFATTVTETKKGSTPVVTHKDKIGKVYQNPRSTMPISIPTPVDNEPIIIDTSGEEEKAYGGNIHRMDIGGPIKPKFNSVTGMWQNYDEKGNPVGAPYKGQGTTYNVKDKDLLDKAKAAGYDIIGNKFAPKVTYIPEQTAKTGFKWNPESGYYENNQFQIGKQGLDETVNIWKDELNQYEGPSGKGVEAWKKDFLNQKGKEGTASKYLVDKANDYSTAAGFGPQVDVTQKAAYVPGQDVFNLKKFVKKPGEQVATTTPAKKEDDINVQQINSSPITDRGGWSKNATLNALNAFAAKRYTGQPYMAHFNFEIPDYVLPDPAQAIAHVQSSLASLNNSADNTMSGNVAFGAKLGSMGQALEQTTGIQSQYDNAGAGIYNQANALGANIYNEFSPLNEKARYAYNDDVQTLLQQKANEDNVYRSNVIKSIISANQEEEKMAALRKILPQVGFDNWNRHIGWSGVGKDWTTYDSYINPMGNSIHENSSDFADDAYNQAYDHAIKRMSPENAEKYAADYSLAVAKAKMSKNGSGYGTNTASDVYSAMFGDK